MAARIQMSSDGLKGSPQSASGACSDFLRQLLTTTELLQVSIWGPSATRVIVVETLQSGGVTQKVSVCVIV